MRHSTSKSSLAVYVSAAACLISFGVAADTTAGTVTTSVGVAFLALVVLLGYLGRPEVPEAEAVIDKTPSPSA